MPERLRDINLLPEVREESSLQANLFFIFVGLILLSFIVMGYLYFSTNSKLQTAETEATELSDERDTLLTQKNSLEADEGTGHEQAVAFAENYAVPTSTLITELNDLLPDDAYLSDYTYRSSEVSVTSHFETLDQVADYTTKLTNSDYLSDTRVDTISTFSLKEEETDETTTNFDVIPRYEGDFSLTIDKQKVKEESTDNE